MDSLSVNSSNLGRQLKQKSVPAKEIEEILSSIDSRYRERLADIVTECQQNMMALETVPSPLRLFIDCMAESGKLLNLSMPSRQLIQRYISAWEDWM